MRLLNQNADDGLRRLKGEHPVLVCEPTVEKILKLLIVHRRELWTRRASRAGSLHQDTGILQPFPEIRRNRSPFVDQVPQYARIRAPETADRRERFTCDAGHKRRDNYENERDREWR